MNFKEGGYWLYAMVGPNGKEHWARFDFNSIVPLVSYSGKDAFCDENGNINQELAGSLWSTKFSEMPGKTVVFIELSFQKGADLEQMIEMGFKEGFTKALDNLDALLNDR